MYLYLTGVKLGNACIKTEKSMAKPMPETERLRLTVGKVEWHFEYCIWFYPPSSRLPLLPITNYLPTLCRSLSRSPSPFCPAQLANRKIAMQENRKCSRCIQDAPLATPTVPLLPYIYHFAVIIDIFATIVLQQFNGFPLPEPAIRTPHSLPALLPLLLACPVQVKSF